MFGLQRIFITLFVAVASFHAQAAERDDSTWSVMGHYVAYEEPGLMKEHGPLYGVAAAYRGAVTNSRFWQLDFEYLTGDKLTYDGSLQDAARTPVTAPTHDRIWSFRGLFGWITEREVLTYSPFVGIALRDLNDKVQHPGGYEREITYLYLPAGLEIGNDLGNGWSWKITGELDLLLSGTVVSHLSDVNSSAPDITNRQDSGFGYRAMFSLVYGGESFGVRIQPYYQHWDVDDSDFVMLTATSYLYEPKNNTKMIGLQVGADF